MKKWFCTLGFLALANPAAFAQSEEAKAACDRAVAWLVSQQREDGSYGRNYETALALYAMAVCPRKYREDDGPFLRRGVESLLARIGEEKDKAALICAQGALKTLNAKKHEKLLRELASRIEADKTVFKRDPLSPPPWTPENLLPKQQGDGSWDRSVEQTSLAIIALSLSKPAPAPRPDLNTSREKGVRFLLANRTDGLWGFPGNRDAGVTALVLSALLAVPGERTPEVEKAVDEGLAYLASLAKPDGAIYDRGYANYTTCIAVMTLVESGRKEYAPLVEKAQSYLVSLQAGEDKGYRPEDKFYGGIGYGGSQRTDLSNTQFALEALDASGLPKDHEVYRKVLTFLTRSQNFSETNRYAVEVDGVSYVPSNDGGGVYYPGNSMAGYDALPDGRKAPRSYGSMTFALLRGYLFAGLPKDDPRLRAAVEWTRRNYTLEENPGFDKAKDGPLAGKQGYFYYLFTMAKALDALGVETIATPDGKERRWREELREKLLSLQKPDGSWANEGSSRWWEGNPVLATAYALATLKYVR